MSEPRFETAAMCSGCGYLNHTQEITKVMNGSLVRYNYCEPCWRKRYGFRTVEEVVTGILRKPVARIAAYTQKWLNGKTG